MPGVGSTGASTGIFQPAEHRNTHKSSTRVEAGYVATAKGHGVDRSMVAQGTHQGSHSVSTKPRCEKHEMEQLIRDETAPPLDDPRAMAEDVDAAALPFGGPSKSEETIPPPYPVGAGVDVWMDAADFGVDSARADGATGGWHRGTVRVLLPGTSNIGVVLDEAPGAGCIECLLDNVRPSGQTFRAASVRVERALSAGRGYRCWLVPRGTTKLSKEPSSIYLPWATGLLIDDLKGLIRQEMRPLLDKVPKAGVHIYYRNPRADDYLLLPPNFPVGGNPLPAVLSDAPGMGSEAPFFWEWDTSYDEFLPPTAAVQPVCAVQPRTANFFPGDIRCAPAGKVA
eukprot:Hpha_TRINITY_DN2227_c0_g1::TRINITY_DN2227_c0_g1_i1::g.25437::m.25437